jgi:hypothetical protein
MILKLDHKFDKAFLWAVYWAQGLFQQLTGCKRTFIDIIKRLAIIAQGEVVPFYFFVCVYTPTLPIFTMKIARATHAKITPLVNKMCSQQACIASLSTSCNNVVILSSCYKVVTHNLLTNC